MELTRIKGNALSNIVIPFSTFSYIVEDNESGAGSTDALAVYCRLLMQVQMQGSTITHSTNTFMEKALGFTESRYKKAKAILVSKGLIRSVANKDEEGRIVSWDVEVLFIIDWELVSKPKEKEKPLKQAKLSRGSKNHPVVSPPGGELGTNSIYTINNSILNKNNNTINSNIENKISEEENSWDEDGGKTKSNISSTIIKQVYSRIADEGLAYSSNAEDVKSAFILSKDSTFIKASEQVGWTTELVDAIMEYAYTDKFWRGKIVSIRDFHKNWHKMYSHLLVNWKIKKKVELRSTDREALMGIFNKI